MDFEFQKCPIFVSSLQNPAVSNQKGLYTQITQNSSVYLGFDAEVPPKILQGLYCPRGVRKYPYMGYFQVLDKADDLVRVLII